jgi:hypothetical protein
MDLSGSLVVSHKMLSGGLYDMDVSTDFESQWMACTRGERGSEFYSKCLYDIGM